MRKQSDRKRRSSSNQRSRRSRSGSNSSIASNLTHKDDKKGQNSEYNIIDSIKIESTQEDTLNEESKQKHFSPSRRHRLSSSKHQSYYSHRSRSPAHRHRSRSSSSNNSLSDRRRRRHESIIKFFF